MPIRTFLQAFAVFTASVLVGGAAMAQSVAPAVSLAGMLGGKALLVVNGGAPKAVAVGESHQGVKLLSIQGDRAVVETGGAKKDLRLGEVPVIVTGVGGPAVGGGRIVMTAGSGGHFSVQGLINGKTTMFLVDTGATSVAIGRDEADRMGLDYRKGQQLRMQTANGFTTGWRIKLSSVKVGDVDVNEVDAVVSSASMPVVLLGNSYLSRFLMNRDGDQMVLSKRF